MTYTTSRILFFLFTAVICTGIACSTNSELKWNEEEGYRWAEVNHGFWGSTGFKMIKSTITNVQFKNQVSKEKIEKNRVFLNGSGVAVGDVDGDGLIDIYFASLEGPNRLYKNLGNYKFKEITKKAGVAHGGFNSTSVVFADVDGDRDLDLLVGSIHKGVTLYTNNGNGNFTPSPRKQFNSTKGKGNMTLSLADIDGDEDLDIYVTNYNQETARDIFRLEELTFKNTGKMVNKKYELRPPFDKYFVLFETEGGEYRGEYGTADELYINLGNGKFEKANDENYFFDEDGNPFSLQKDWGLTATFRDVNADLLPDLYVANDFWTPDRFWINQGDGTFKPIGKKAIRNMSFASMGVDFSDINRDGILDFVVTEMLSPEHTMRMRHLSQQIEEEYQGRTHYNRNSVYLNRGDTTFAQIAYYSNLEASGWSWATTFMDINLDGYEDLIINTGFFRDAQDMDTQMTIRKKRDDKKISYPILKYPNKLFMNNGDLTFTDKSTDWGFESEDISMGMAMADLNNDGDLELVINRFNDEAVIYENKNNNPRISVRLKGEGANTQGIGAKIKLIGGPVVQQKELYSGGTYLSGSEPLVTFAANQKNHNHKIKVIWPSGKESYIEHVEPNRIYEINESSAIEPESEIRDVNENNYPIFKDVSERISFKHHEQDFDDFIIQPLLPLKLSQLGPGIAWIDTDQDKDDDLIIGSGKGGNIGFFENKGNGQFESRRLEGIGDNIPGDVTGILGWTKGDHTKIVFGSSNYEDEFSTSSSGLYSTIKQNQVISRDTIPGAYSTTGPLASADYDGDGHLDLFVGGRFVPTQYPRDADSRLFTNKNNDYILDQKNSKALEQIGLVTSAVFTDYDGDNDPDLLVSTEWGSLKLFRNVEGSFREVTISNGLNEYKGWWNGVATGDFNSDGLPDFVATNLGMNSAYKIEAEHPLKIYYDDFDGDQNVEIIESYYDSATDSYVPRRSLDDLRQGIPAIIRNIPSYRDFAHSSLQKLLGVPLNQIPSKEINTVRHMIFLNNGDGFTAHPLPKEAQFTAAFNAGVADFNNDGNEDIFLSQNLFSLPEFIPRLDAGRGLWLQGDGEGNFEAVDGSRSGIKIYGDQRGAALGDINSDGKIDLAVTQNGGPLKLYLNETPESGITINLNGPDSNKDGIGSSVRLVYEDGSKGPLREIQAGSGYWSQNSSTQIMGIEKEKSLEEIEIGWFNGRQQRVEVTPEIQRYTVEYPSDL